MTTPEMLWTALLSAALVGTERRTTTLPQAEGQLGALLAALDSSDTDGALLAAAAAVALQRRAGRLPIPGSARPIDPGPADDAPACPPRAAEHLGAMLSGVHRDVLPEWLGALAASGRIAPPAHLPALLALGRAEAELRPRILPVLGRRGRWLAALRPDWDYGAAPPQAGAAALDQAALLAQWETGSRTARRTMLQQLRASDPAAGLALVESSWQSERADERTTLLEALSDGLSMADEPFLEGALDDRSGGVRASAAELLARLPGSRLAARMAERAAPLLRWTPGEAPRMLGLRPARPPKLAVELPESVDKAAQRDGVELKGGRRGLGERGWWLVQILARTPPAVWTATFGAPPAVIVRATLDKEWRGPVLEAWAEAARRYADAEWVEALLGLVLEGAASELDVAGLVAQLPAARQEQVILGLLRDHPDPLTGDHPALAPLRAFRQPWSRALGVAVLDSLRRRAALLVAGQRYTDWHLRAALEEFARVIPPELAPEVETVWGDKRQDLPHWNDVIAHVEATVAFRHAMLAALAT